MRVQTVLVVATQNQNKSLPITANRVAVIPVDTNVDKEMAELCAAAQQISDCPRPLNEVSFDDTLLVVTSTACAEMLKCDPEELRNFLYNEDDYKVLVQTVPYDSFEKLEDRNLHPEGVTLVVHLNAMGAGRSPDIRWRYDLDPGADNSEEVTAAVPLNAFTELGRRVAVASAEAQREEHLEELRWSHTPAIQTYGP